MSSLSSLFSPSIIPQRTGQARQTKQKLFIMDFNHFLTLFQPDREFTNRLGAAQRLWEQSTAHTRGGIRISLSWTSNRNRCRCPTKTTMQNTARPNPVTAGKWRTRPDSKLFM